MSKEEFKAKFEQVKIRAFNIFFDSAPVDTGALRSSILLVETDNGFQITIGAPYTEYTNEKGKNAGWIDKAMQDAFNMIVREMSV